MRGCLVALMIVMLAAPGGAQPPPAENQGRLRADRIRYETKTQVIVATGNVSLVIGDLEIRADSLRLDQKPQVVIVEGHVRVQQRDTRLTASALRYEIKTEIADASGGVVLVQKDSTIRAPQIRFELRDEVTTATGGVEAVQDGGTLTAESVRQQARTGNVVAEGGVKLVREGSTLVGRRLMANLNTKRAEVQDEVTLVRAQAKEETTISAARIVFRWDVNEAEAEGNVVVRQKDKTAWSDRMLYSEPSNRLVLTGSVIVEQLSGEWLSAVTRLTSSRLTMTLKERNIVAEGPVKVTQKDRWASGDHATYTEATHLLVVTGAVRVQEADGRRLQADRVVISTVDETFDAEGNVQTEFVIRSAPTPTRKP